MVDACTIYRVIINMMIRNSNLPRQVFWQLKWHNVTAVGGTDFPKW